MTKTDTLTSNGNRLKGALDDEAIDFLFANTSGRNQYAEPFAEFLASDEKAINVQECWPTLLGGKSANTVYQGFINAAKKFPGGSVYAHADNPDGYIMVKIVSKTGSVFLVNKKRLSIVTDDDAE